MADIKFFAAITVAAFRDCLGVVLEPVRAFGDRVDTWLADYGTED